MFFLTMALSQEEERVVQELYEQYGRQMRGYAYRFLQSHEQAEDAVHEAFLRIIGNLERLLQMEPDKRKAYLGKVIQRVCIDLYNKEKREQNVLVDLDLCQPEPDLSASLWEGFDAQLTRQWLVEELRSLSGLDRELLTYKMLHGWSNREIAAITGLGENNVSVRISRIRQRLYHRYRQKKEEGKL